MSHFWYSLSPSFILFPQVETTTILLVVVHETFPNSRNLFFRQFNSLFFHLFSSLKSLRCVYTRSRFHGNENDFSCVLTSILFFYSSSLFCYFLYFAATPSPLYCRWYRRRFYFMFFFLPLNTVRCDHHLCQKKKKKYRVNGYRSVVRLAILWDSYQDFPKTFWKFPRLGNEEFMWLENLGRQILE